jgi:hypothetical protein
MVVVDAQCNKLTKGPPELVSALLFIGGVRGVHIGVRALHVLNFIWFGNISRPSLWRGEG